jgi:phosphoglycolate phosphatase
MSDLRLVVFDVDGTLVDSEGDIFAAMKRAHEALDLMPPTRDEVRAIVGLSLDVAFARLSTHRYVRHRDALIAGYKSAYHDMRVQKGAASSPLYPGARKALETLRADPWTVLAVATGKSKRGLDALIENHGFQGWFMSRQVADFHPSKPHPSMLEAIIAETGIPAAQAVMVGDTTFDMEMARAVGMGAIGVSWGYHPADRLIADEIIDDFASLSGALARILGAETENRS